VKVTRSLGATGLTIALLAAGLALALRERLPEATSAARGEDVAGEPRAVFREMVRTSRAGEANAYLDLFAGPVREQLETVRNEMGEPAFENYLRQRFVDLVGYAVTDEEKVGDVVRLEVEYVREASYVVQYLDFRASRGRWRIVAVGPVHERQPPVPYGTPVEPAE